MKRFLPAVLRHSPAVRGKCSKPVYGTADFPSPNFRSRTWVVEQDGEILDRYQLLDPLFEEQDINRASQFLERSEGDVVANGAAAMIAYAQLQDPSVDEWPRKRLEEQLKRYCELDTLAMVMVYEALLRWSS